METSNLENTLDKKLAYTNATLEQKIEAASNLTNTLDKKLAETYATLKYQIAEVFNLERSLDNKILSTNKNLDEAVNKLMLTTAISKTAWETVNQVNFEFGKKIVYLEANVDGLLARKAAEKQ